MDAKELEEKSDRLPRDREVILYLLDQRAQASVALPPQEDGIKEFASCRAAWMLGANAATRSVTVTLANRQKTRAPSFLSALYRNNSISVVS